MQVTQIAEWIQARLDGDGSIAVTEARPIHDAGTDSITLVTDDRHAQQFSASRCCVAVVSAQIAAIPGKTLLRCDDPLGAFIRVVEHLHPPRPHCWPGVHSSAQVHPSARLASDVMVGPHCTVGADTTIAAGTVLHPGAVVGSGCIIGTGTILYPNSVLYDGTVLGNRVIIHAGAVIGADGFGFKTKQGRHHKVPQLGNVEIADDVEVGANTTIDRATFGSTRIGEGTKIDNLVMIGHNCRIGKHNIFASQVGIAGSCSTGEYVIMAGQVGIKDHCHIGDRSILGAKCGVHKDVPADQQMLGAPATPQREQLRVMMTLEKLPEIRRDVRAIKDKLGMSDDAA